MPINRSIIDNKDMDIGSDGDEINNNNKITTTLIMVIPIYLLVPCSLRKKKHVHLCVMCIQEVTETT